MADNVSDRNDGKTMMVAVLVASGVEQGDLAEPLQCLEEAGIPYQIIGPDENPVVAWDKASTRWGREFDVHVPLDAAQCGDYDLLFLPGSVMNPDALRKDARAIDFVCRFFAPHRGVAEDSATGSAYCTLAPYWAARLGRTSFRARQLSPRGGEVLCADEGDAVRVGGRVETVIEGELHV